MTTQPENTEFGHLTEQQVRDLLEDTNKILPLEYADPNEPDLKKVRVKVPNWGYDPDGPPWGLTGNRCGLFGCAPYGRLPAGYVNFVSEVYKYFKNRDDDVPEWYEQKYPYTRPRIRAKPRN